MTPQDRRQLEQMLRSFDEAALVALANKGLVRRAAKDLQSSELRIEETDDAVLVHGPGWTVTMPPDGPAGASDDTKATGVSRQILCATMYLRQHWQTEDDDVPKTDSSSEEPTVQDAGAETLVSWVMEITDEELQKWTGKTLLREILPLVRAMNDAVVETSPGVIVRFPKHDVEARLLPDRTIKRPKDCLERMLTTAPKSLHKQWVATAVVVLWKNGGRPLPSSTSSVSTFDDKGAPRSRAELMRSTKQLLQSVIATGLAHPSQRTFERLSTLSVSLGSVNAPRLARLLSACASDVQLIIHRDAKADNGRLLDRISTAYALATAVEAALPQPPVSLTGRPREVYEPAGSLRLAGVGAYPWQTASGYEGLTVLFWDLEAKRFLTWSDSRPIEGGGWYDVSQIYQSESPWLGAGAAKHLCRHHVSLDSAYVNPQGRLSSSRKSTAVESEETDPKDVDFGDRLFTRWQALVDHAARVYPIGLTDSAPLDRVVVLRPARWGDRIFEELHQRFVWPVIDEEGAALEVSLPWTGVNESSIEFLESVKPSRDKLWGITARIVFGGSGLAVEPLALLSEGTPKGDRVLCPAFDAQRLELRSSNLLARLRKKFGRDRITTTLSADDEDDQPVAADNATVPPGILSRLSEWEGIILRLAESGARRIADRDRQRITELADEMSRLGLRALSESTYAVQADADFLADRLLRAHYVCRLHRQAMCRPR